MAEEAVFRALADPSRRRLLDLLFARDGRTLTELESQLPMTRFGVMKHLRVLEEAGLITTRKVGRERLHYLNPVPIRRIADRWINKYLQEVSMSQPEKKGQQGFTPEERAAMKERAKELKAEARASKSRAAGESAVLAAIAAMPEGERAMAGRLHELITASAPALVPKTWYGMPAYAKDGQILCFFQSAQKYNTRYATLGFNDTANLDQGAMWPTAFALTELTAAEEERIVALVQQAVS